MTQRHRAIILLAGSALIACVGAAQEAQPAAGRDFRIYRIYLAGTTGKPVAIKASVEKIESTDGGKSSLQALGRGVGARQGRPGLGACSCASGRLPGETATPCGCLVV